MKFKAMGYNHGQSIKDQIVKRFREMGFISLGDAKELAGDYAQKDDKYIGWDEDSDLDRKIRVRETKSGWFLYLPDPNAIIKIGDEPVIIDDNKDQQIFDMLNKNYELMDKANEESQELLKKELRTFENINLTLEMGFSNIRSVLTDTLMSNGYLYRTCIVKARKSGTKEQRQDRRAKFHRWADLTKGVQQVVAIVEFEDGHVEQVQPDRVVFTIEEIMEEE